MKLAVIRQVQRVKVLQADRAEQEERARRAGLEAAAAAVETARANLERWREEMPRREAAIYDAIIGKLVDLEALDACKARVVELREHEALLAKRLQDAEGAATAAREALEFASQKLAHARRAVSKFDELVATLRAAELLDAEAKEDAELEEAAEAGHRVSKEGNEDEWDKAA
ncbi:YscO family type III secretion system apparatus protein [Hyphomicrobium sp. MC1]|uniref:type III secretion system stalk subunit SctO n=1 Tax=Hyphomicrobium sp. (strain MC1) TaxID=717785 RepID=UPI000213EFDD|nr:YscO family type III secretion system apparatus protein [Hyphomicrobium sp. MC1]CCB66682.1 putative type III secretion protein YscO [Hyphomicrobium sp. MC1]